MYTPILRWKRGEQKALEMLADEIKEKIIPVLSLSATTHLPKFSQDVARIWGRKPYFVYFEQDWFNSIEEDGPEFAAKVYATCEQNYKLLDQVYAIPVFDLTNEYSIEHWQKQHTGDDIAVRIARNEFGDIEGTLNKIISTTSNRNSTYLLLDLESVDTGNLFAKEAVLKGALADIDFPDEYKAIIIASNSFPSSFSNLEQGKIYAFDRHEVKIHDLAKRLSQKWKFNYFFADYGPTDLSDTVFIIGMSPNFKIKYTGLDKYYYIKGVSVKRGGLDFEQVRELCRVLVAAKDTYSGETFSWADSEIMRIARSSSAENTKTGNLTTWVSYGFNHHMTFIVWEQH
ncbi:beta family protein [Parasphaerochaeta coccoides]|uniref:Uncharacterized protein n=1 Tax=Parasphaerochaeta coccoides (strain ATCC BAA-1237 / DSM 17374 / SPN1) TaxID=760011 RepID=F4GHF0_PARC1|nr:beta family protein [Parasphaerochaeta coccoides]AEC02049.1 hypothetical protein Spico_0825 [Parasphaerochaeta coccoides DSM 17374]